MLSKINAALRRALASLFDAPVNSETLAATYAKMTDGALRRLAPNELTPVARALWQAEINRRQKPRAAPAPSGKSTDAS